MNLFMGFIRIRRRGRRDPRAGGRRTSRRRAARRPGRRRRHVLTIDETEEEAYASRAGCSAPDWEVEGRVTSYLAVRNGEVEGVTRDLRRLTGHDGTSLQAFLAR
jgi:hypothetical protein